MENYLKSIYKYLTNSVEKSDIVFYFKNEKFYILSDKTNIDEFSANLIKLNARKQVSFKFGVSKFLESDNVFSFLSRCNQALEESKVLKIDLQIK